MAPPHAQACLPLIWVSFHTQHLHLTAPHPRGSGSRVSPGQVALCTQLSSFSNDVGGVRDLRSEMAGEGEIGGQGSSVILLLHEGGWTEEFRKSPLPSSQCQNHPEGLVSLTSSLSLELQSECRAGSQHRPEAVPRARTMAPQPDSVMSWSVGRGAGQQGTI